MIFPNKVRVRIELWSRFVMRQSLNAPSAPEVDRCSEKVHMFLVATLYFGGASSPVRVRNTSTAGALIEGAALPAAGAAIILRRGALEAPATTAWSKAGKAGVAFDGSVEVSDWLPAKDGIKQTQVDQIAFGLKHSVQAVAPAAVPTIERATSTMAVLAELAELQAQLGHLGDRLAGDTFVLVHHPEVQLLDAAGQRIGRIIKALQTAAAT